MTAKNVIISIQGRQFFPWPEEDSEPIELVTAGRMNRSDNETVLTYKESDLTGFGGTFTTLMVHGDCVTMLRCGQVTTQMVFEQGRRHLSMYETDDGPLMVGVKARRVLTAMGDSGGDIDMEYEIEIDHAVSGINSVHINVREAGGAPGTDRFAEDIVVDRYIN